MKKLQNREITALEVLEAYQSAAIEATQRINCVTGFIEEATQWAKDLDSEKEITKPLHGLPISLKENVQVNVLRMRMN